MTTSERFGIMAMLALLLIGAIASIWTYDWRYVVTAAAVVLTVSFYAVLTQTPKRN